jgi:hypothetical protein
MPVKDTFKYASRWNSVGLDCSSCRHFHGPEKWPDVNRVSRCELHGVSLAIELADTGYKSMEWFCQEFTDTGKAFASSVAHLHEIRQQLEAGVLYGFYGADGYLVERKIVELKKTNDIA